MGIYPLSGEGEEDFHNRVVDHIIKAELPDILRELSEIPVEPRIRGVYTNVDVFDEDAVLKICSPDIVVVYVDNNWRAMFLEVKSRYHTESSHYRGSKAIKDLEIQLRILRECIQRRRSVLESVIAGVGVPREVIEIMDFRAEGLYRNSNGRIQIYRTQQLQEDYHL